MGLRLQGPGFRAWGRFEYESLKGGSSFRELTFTSLYPRYFRKNNQTVSGSVGRAWVLACRSLAQPCRAWGLKAGA